jgi:hypothetical protein
LSLTLAEPSTPEDDDELGDLKCEIGSSSSDDDFAAAEGNLPPSSSAGSDRKPLTEGVFSSWKDITNAVHREALRDNKQVSCTASLSGIKKKVYKCVHWLGCVKRHVQKVRDWACEKYPDDHHMRAECMKLNPFRDQGACFYSVVAHWNKQKGFHVCVESSNFSHNRYFTANNALSFVQGV